MPTVAELVDKITQALDAIEDKYNEEGTKPDDAYDIFLASIDQELAMLKATLGIRKDDN